MIVVCGVNELNSTEMSGCGIDECLELAKGVDSQYAMENAFELVQARLSESKVLRDL